MKRYVIGIDVGGTNIKLGVISSTGKIVARSRLVTKGFLKSKPKLISALADSILELLASKGIRKNEVEGIGIGLPGLINSEKGIVNVLPNIPGWKNVPLKSILQKKLRLPVYIENDVNLITFGEWKYGAGKGYRNLMCMTLGTGVGAGLILNGELYRGEGNAAGELGHMPLNERGRDCNCGGFACFERTVGNKTILAKASRIFKRKIHVFPEIYPLAKAGNKKALKFWHETGTHVGNGLVGVINLLNLRLVIIGGGVSNNLPFMKKAINDVIKRRAMKVQAKMVKIVRAKLDDDAGLIGALVLVKGRGIVR